jgi:hypothetical protein
MPYPVQFEISPDVTQLSKGTIAISGVLRYDSMGVTLEYRTTDRGMTAEDNRLVLKIKRRDGTAAARAAWDLQVAVEERKLRHLRE